MEYIGRVPAPPLDRFIDDIYCLTGVPRYHLMSVPPMPSADLFVNLGEPAACGIPTLPCRRRCSPMRGSWAYGPGGSATSTRPGCGSSGCTSSPGGCHRSPACRRTSCGTDGYRPTPSRQRSVDRIRNQLGDTASATETLRVLEEELRARLAGQPPRGLDLVLHAGGRLAASHGAASVSALADAAGVSGNHLAAQFKSHVGVTPKRVARIDRFARLILSVDASARPAGLAEARSHGGLLLTRPTSAWEFKDFTGHTPTEYPALRRRFPAEQGFRDADSGPMPADRFFYKPAAAEGSKDRGRMRKRDPRRTVAHSDHAQRGVGGRLHRRRGTTTLGHSIDWYFSGDNPVPEDGGQQYAPFRRRKQHQGPPWRLGGLCSADAGVDRHDRDGPQSVRPGERLGR